MLLFIKAYITLIERFEPLIYGSWSLSETNNTFVLYHLLLQEGKKERKNYKNTFPYHILGIYQNILPIFCLDMVLLLVLERSRNSHIFYNEKDVIASKKNAVLS